MAVAGIYFGNSNSVISVCMDGRIETVSNETGYRITPTVVGYTGTEKVVGQPAKQYMQRNPLSCISNIKACIGQSFTEEHTKNMKDSFSSEVSNVNGCIQYEVRVDEKKVSVSTVDAASYVLTKLLEIAELVGGEDLEDTVLAVPLDFSDEQILALREAAENVGCNILRVISEPAAALLAYGISQNDHTTESICLVFRLGASSMDATVLESRNGMYKVVGQKINRNFGGNQFDEQLVEYMVDEFKKKYKEDISKNRRAISKLKTAVENCKHGLSQMESNTCAVESLYDGMDFSKSIHRAKFESLCGSLFNNCVELVNDVLTSCQMNDTSIDKVVLVGGGVRMPRLVRLFKDRFPHSDIMNNILPDEAISNGAALQAALLSGKEDISIANSSTHLECTSKNIGIKVLKDGRQNGLELMVPKHSPIPIRRSRKFDGPPAQVSICLCLYEYDKPVLETANLVAQIVLKDLPEGKGKRYEITMEFNRTGDLTVSLREELSDRIVKLNIGNST